MKERKLAELAYIDPKALLKLAEVAGFGARKYEPGNYLKGFNWSYSYNALHRHILAFWDGEDIDLESELPHLAHAAWHCLCLLCFSMRDIGKDDRIGTKIENG